MLTRLASSGDALADRRYQWADGLLAEGDATAAAMLLAETAMMVPHWPAVWARLGDAYAADDAVAAAADAYRKAVEVDPGDVLGAGLKLARLRLDAPPAAPPPAHVGALFDTYAPRFDALLVDGLGYDGPRLIAGLVDAARPAPADGGPRFEACLDLGCGTGLVAAAVRPWCRHVVGVDLSTAMLDVAAAKRADGAAETPGGAISDGRPGDGLPDAGSSPAAPLYDGLVAGEAVAVLEDGSPLGDDRYDLIVAGDVLCYLGDHAPLFAGVARRLVPGGLFAATTEAAQPGEAGPNGWALRDSLRYAHDGDRLVALAAAAGLRLIESRAGVLRHDRGAPIEAGVFLFVGSEGTTAE